MSKRAVALARRIHSGWTTLPHTDQQLYFSTARSAMSAMGDPHCHTIIRCSSKQTWRQLKRKKGSANGEEMDDAHALDDSASTTSRLQESSWVPPAYRGIGSDAKPGRRSSTAHSRYTDNRSDRRRGRPSSREWEGQHQHTRSSTLIRGDDVLLDSDETERIRLVKREKEESIANLMNELERLSATYRRHFKTTAQPTMLKSHNAATWPPTHLQRHVLTVLQEIHTVTNGPITLRHVEASEVDFRYLCRALRHMCSLACGLSTLTRYDDRDAAKYVDLSEFLLLQLVQLDQDRIALTETALQSSLTSPAPTASGTTTSESSDDASLRTVTGWFSKLVEGFVPSLASDTEPKDHAIHSRDASGPNAPTDKEASDDDSGIQSMKRLLRIVLRNMAASVRLEKEPALHTSAMPGIMSAVGGTASATTHEYRTACEQGARRMLDLLDGMPVSWSPDAEAVRYIMETLCRAGTLSGARSCQAVFQRFSSPDCRLQFALVLESYLEAIQLEHDPDKLAIVVAEVMDLLTTQWNISWPSHRVERILQCSIVLHCMALGHMGRLPGMCERGDGIVTRALGSNIANSFRNELDAEQPKVETQTLPLANHLAHLYATSHDESRVLAAKKMLKYMMHHDSIMLYPNTDTCNAVLVALIQLYERKLVGTNDTNMDAARLDFAFAQDVLHFMQTRSDTGCGPNGQTLDVLFRFLDVIQPPDVGHVAEDLLTMMEAQKAHYIHSPLDETIPLTTYHRVMRYWLQVAKTPSAESVSSSDSLPCERALRLLKRLEVQSIPSTLSDSALDHTTVRNLYDTGLRPVRKTYKLVLQICADTGDHETAATVAIKVQEMMNKRRFPSGDDTDGILSLCSSRLAPDSSLRRDLESHLERAVPS